MKILKSKGSLVHGHARKGLKTPEWITWSCMRDRCSREKSTSWRLYGGRGIKVCKRWRKFENFLSDMGKRPEGMSLDRIDNNGPYSPENCRWATALEQASNKRIRKDSRVLTLNGKSQSLSLWSREIGVCIPTLWRRLELGWGDEKALTKPVRLKRNNKTQV